MTNEELLQIIEQAVREKVTELDLSDIGLTTLPSEIVQLTNLQTLHLGGNQLSSLPPEIRELSNLNKLDLRRNPLPVGTPLPKLWIRVRAALENDSRNYISFEEYCNLCRVNNLTDRKDMLRLSSYLHDLGVCLHFQDDSTLKHYVILKPEWGTTAVYKVLDSQTVNQKLGCFTKENLKDIWQDGEYADMQDQ